MGQKFMGYRRENGRVGVRNHVVILPLDDISNACAVAVANNVKGTLALPHHFGRLQFGRDLDLLFRQLIGIGSNPNVAACVVIGIEASHWTQKVADGIAKTGKPVAMFGIERHGDLNTIERASRKAKEFVQWATELQREECDISELVVSVKCGESDTTSGLASCPTVGKAMEILTGAGASCSFGETTELTGGEHIVAARMRTPELKEKFMALFNDYQALIEREEADLLGSQPTQGNIIGGLTTIEEKALGNIQKIGKCMVDGVLESAEEIPAKTGQVWYMDTSSAAGEAVTLWAAGGAVIHLFPTGQGNIIGNPILPVIKLSANPITVETMSEHIDLDVSGVLRRELTLDQAGEKLVELVLRTANGRNTSAETLGHQEFIINKLYRSA